MVVDQEGFDGGKGPRRGYSRRTAEDGGHHFLSNSKGLRVSGERERERETLRFGIWGLGFRV